MFPRCLRDARVARIGGQQPGYPRTLSVSGSLSRPRKPQLSKQLQGKRALARLESQIGQLKSGPMISRFEDIRLLENVPRPLGFADLETGVPQLFSDRGAPPRLLRGRLKVADRTFVILSSHSLIGCG